MSWKFPYIWQPLVSFYLFIGGDGLDDNDGFGGFGGGSYGNRYGHRHSENNN